MAKRRKLIRTPGRYKTWSTAALPVPKKYTQGYINVGPTPNREFMGQYRDKALLEDPWLSVLFKDNSVPLKKLVEEWGNRKPRLVSPETNSDEGLGPYYIDVSGRYADYPVREQELRDDAPPLVRVYQKYLEIIEDTSIERCITMYNGSTGHLRLFYNKSPTHEWHFFVFQDKIMDQVKRSINYPSSVKAIDAYKMKLIRWRVTLDKSEIPEE